jgi:hypothetical protein
MNTRLELGSILIHSGMSGCFFPLLNHERSAQDWYRESSIINRSVILVPKFLLVKPLSLRITVHGLGMRSSSLELTIQIWNQFFRYGIVHHLAMLPGLGKWEVFVRSRETVPMPLTRLHGEAISLIKSTA